MKKPNLDASGFGCVVWDQSINHIFLIFLLFSDPGFGRNTCAVTGMLGVSSTGYKKQNASTFDIGYNLRWVFGWLDHSQKKGSDYLPKRSIGLGS